jgi:hypothetical protein
MTAIYSKAVKQALNVLQALEPLQTEELNAPSTCTFSRKMDFPFIITTTPNSLTNSLSFTPATISSYYYLESFI